MANGESMEKGERDDLDPQQRQRLLVKVPTRRLERGRHWQPNSSTTVLRNGPLAYQASTTSRSKNQRP